MIVFYEKSFIEEVIAADELPDNIIELFKGAIEQCQIYEEAGLSPIIGYCSDPQNVLVTSKERYEGLFKQ